MSDLTKLVDIAARRCAARRSRSRGGGSDAELLFRAVDKELQRLWRQLVGRPVRLVATDATRWCRQRDHGWLPDTAAVADTKEGRLLELIHVYEYYAAINALSEFRQADALVIEDDRGHRWMLPLADMSSDKSELLELDLVAKAAAR